MCTDGTMGSASCFKSHDDTSTVLTSRDGKHRNRDNLVVQMLMVWSIVALFFLRLEEKVRASNHFQHWTDPRCPLQTRSTVTCCQTATYGGPRSTEAPSCANTALLQVNVQLSLLPKLTDR